MRTISYQLELDVLPWWRNVRADTYKSISKVYRQTCTMTLFQMLQTTMNAMAILMVLSCLGWFGTRTIIPLLYLEDVHIDKALFYFLSSNDYNCCIRTPSKHSSTDYKCYIYVLHVYKVLLVTIAAYVLHANKALIITNGVYVPVGRGPVWLDTCQYWLLMSPVTPFILLT